MKCNRCGKELDALDIGLSRKLTGKDCREFSCVNCLAEYFGATPERMREKIAEFRRAGCRLFPPLDDDESMHK